MRSTFVDSRYADGDGSANSEATEGSQSSSPQADSYVPAIPAPKNEQVNRENDVLKGFIPGNNAPAVSSDESSDYKQRSFSTGAWTGSRVERLHAGPSSSRGSDELFSPDDLNKNLGLDGQTEKSSAWDAVAKHAEPNYQALESAGSGSFHHYSPMDFFSEPEEQEAAYNQDETIDGVPSDLVHAIAHHDQMAGKVPFAQHEAANEFIDKINEVVEVAEEVSVDHVTEEKWGNDWQAEEQPDFEPDYQNDPMTNESNGETDEYEDLGQRLENEYGGLAPLPEKVLQSSAQERRIDGDLVFEPLPAELASYFDDPTDLEHGLPSQVDPAILAEMERERKARVRMEVQESDQRTLSRASVETNSGKHLNVSENLAGGGRKLAASSSDGVSLSNNELASATQFATATGETSTPTPPVQVPAKKSLIEKLFGWLPFLKKEAKLDVSDIRALSRRKSQTDTTAVMEQSAESNLPAVSPTEIGVFPASPIPQVEREYEPQEKQDDVAHAPMPETVSADAFSPAVPQAREQLTESVVEVDNAIDPEIAKLAASVIDDGAPIETELATTTTPATAVAEQFDVAAGANSAELAAGEKTVFVEPGNDVGGNHITAAASEFVPAVAAASTNLFDAVPPKKMNREDLPVEDSQKPEDDESEPATDAEASSPGTKSGKLRKRFPPDEDPDDTKQSTRGKDKNKKVSRKRTAEAPIAKPGKTSAAAGGRTKPFPHRNTDDKTFQIGPIEISSNFLIMCTVTCVFVGFPAFVLLGLVKNIVAENKDSPMLPAILKTVAKDAVPDLPASAIPDEMPGVSPGAGQSMPGMPGMPGAQGGGQVLPRIPGMPAAQGGGQVLPGMPVAQGGGMPMQGAPQAMPNAQPVQGEKPSGFPGFSLPSLPGFGGPSPQQTPNPSAAVQGQSPAGDFPEPMPAMQQSGTATPIQTQASAQTKAASAVPPPPPRKPDLKHLSGIWALDFKNQAGQIGRGRMVVEHKGNQIRGNGDDAYGSYQIGGTINKNHVFFRKAYIRNGRIHGNPIPYDGKLSMDKKRGFPRIDGQWKLSRREGYNTLSHVSTHSYAFRAMMLEMAPDEKELKARAAQQQAQAANQQSLQNMLDTVPVNDSSVPVQQSGPQ